MDAEYATRVVRISTELPFRVEDSAWRKQIGFEFLAYPERTAAGVLLGVGSLSGARVLELWEYVLLLGDLIPPDIRSRWRQAADDSPTSVTALVAHRLGLTWL